MTEVRAPPEQSGWYAPQWGRREGNGPWEVLEGRGWRGGFGWDVSRRPRAGSKNGKMSEEEEEDEEEAEE